MDNKKKVALDSELIIRFYKRGTFTIPHYWGKKRSSVPVTYLTDTWEKKNIFLN